MKYLIMLDLNWVTSFKKIIENRIMKEPQDLDPGASLFK